MKGKPIWEKARPGNGESVTCNTELFHDCNILREAMVMITGDIAVFTIGYFSWSCAKSIPNTRATTINRCRTFDLVTRGCNAPVKVSRKLHD